MPLPSSGTITLTQIQTEFGGAAPTNLTEYYRGGAYVTSNNTNVPTSGAISLTNFYGAVRQFAFTISSNQTNANLRSLAVAAGWDQSAPVVATLASGIYISSNSTGTPALTVNGSFPAGVQLINSGTIVGMGGKGGTGAGGSSSKNGAAGGAGLAVSVAISITNNGTVAGGGGGGGGGAYQGESYGGDFGDYPNGAGGGGGGRSGVPANSAGGVGSSGWNGVFGATGGVGTVSSAGGGGGGASSEYGSGGTGGTGGGWGSAGASGGAGAGGTVFIAAGPGGAAGAAASGNSNITWLVTGTRLGPLT